MESRAQILSAGYLLADDIDPQHDCMIDYPRSFFETNVVSLSVLYILQVRSSEGKWTKK